MITHEMKWGKYVIVWIVRLSRIYFISLSSSARIIGTGKPKTSFMRLIATVFRTTWGNSSNRNSSRKNRNPTHSLSSIPCIGL
ncbi:hypothetical protein [Cohnella rhizosphaerae]|uniref:Uncharacterized protein n=1 Tax=Cohnella rhizosphaerae TaxID=1457232 RepID=A0A9X4KS31_9BACL|nr:hypothetical protein [Cohnella rhizosphaerae]MDG0809880.1 hypothetical protein [Cohnella rhizosphaerae]